MLNYQKEVFNNGIRLLTEEVPHVRSVSLGIWVQVGSRDEDPEISGISHFIEHMLFKGTEKRSAKDIAESLEAVGGQLNAFTTKEYTCFYIRLLDEHLDLGLDVLSDMFFNSLFNPKEIDTERNVVLEEIKMYEDSPDEIIHDLFARTAWKGHPLGRPILGSVDAINVIDESKIREYFSRYYCPSNTIISAAGRIDQEILNQKLRRVFEGWEQPRKPNHYHSPLFQSSVLAQKKDTEQVQICLGVPGLKQSDDRIYELYVLNNVLGGGVSSRLFQEVREQRGLAYSVYSYHSSYRDSGLFCVYACTSPRNRDEVIRLVIDELQSIKTSGITPEELKRSQDQIKGNIYLGMESVSNRMTRLGKSEIYHDRVIDPDEVIEKVSRVTRDQVTALAEQMIRPEKMVLTTIGPEQAPAVLEDYF
ncbi:MAG: insulinase family protein [Firmicutes bacterium]|nr:insulinase family protein [Bacillota bacterium]